MQDNCGMKRRKYREVKGRERKGKEGRGKHHHHHNGLAMALLNSIIFESRLSSIL